MRCGRRRADRLLDRGGRVREEMVVEVEKEDILLADEEEKEEEIERLRPQEEEEEGEEEEVVIQERAFWVAAEEKEEGKKHAKGSKASFKCWGYRITETDAAGLVIENSSSNRFPPPRVLVFPPALLVRGRYARHCIKLIVLVSAARGIIRTSTVYLCSFPFFKPVHHRVNSLVSEEVMKRTSRSSPGRKEEWRIRSR